MLCITYSTSSHQQQHKSHLLSLCKYIFSRRVFFWFRYWLLVLVQSSLHFFCLKLSTDSVLVRNEWPFIIFVPMDCDFFSFPLFLKKEVVESSREVWNSLYFSLLQKLNSQVFNCGTIHFHIVLTISSIDCFHCFFCSDSNCCSSVKMLLYFYLFILLQNARYISYIL